MYFSSTPPSLNPKKSLQVMLVHLRCKGKGFVWMWKCKCYAGWKLTASHCYGFFWKHPQ